MATEIQDSLKPNHPSTSGSVTQNARNASDLSVGHKQLARKISKLAEERSNMNSGGVDGELDSFSASSGSGRNDCHGRKDQDDEVGKQLAKQNQGLLMKDAVKILTVRMTCFRRNGD